MLQTTSTTPPALLPALLLGLGAAAAGPDRPVVLFVHFTTQSENLHMAYSRDGLKFTALNGPRTGQNRPPCPNCTTPVLTLPGCHAPGCPSLGPSAHGSGVTVVPSLKLSKKAGMTWNVRTSAKKKKKGGGNSRVLSLPSK